MPDDSFETWQLRGAGESDHWCVLAAQQSDQCVRFCMGCLILNSLISRNMPLVDAVFHPLVSIQMFAAKSVTGKALEKV